MEVKNLPIEAKEKKWSLIVEEISSNGDEDDEEDGEDEDGLDLSGFHLKWASHGRLGHARKEEKLEKERELLELLE